MNNIHVPYKVLLPQWVFENCSTNADIHRNALKYFQLAYPERILIEVRGTLAICEMKNN